MAWKSPTPQHKISVKNLAKQLWPLNLMVFPAPKSATLHVTDLGLLEDHLVGLSLDSWCWDSLHRGVTR